MYTLETDIPPPPVRSQGAGRHSIYPFADMAVGASFAAHGNEADRIGDAAKSWKKRHPGWNYVTRRRGDDFRIWRVA